jgi:hypothetical protein
MYATTPPRTKPDSPALARIHLRAVLSHFLAEFTGPARPALGLRLSEHYAGHARRGLEALDALEDHQERSRPPCKARVARPAPDPIEWPCWTSDDSRAYTERTPLEVLACQLPPLRGGAPEAYEPTPEDWCEYARWSRFHEMVEAIAESECSTSRLTDEDLRAAGLPVG